MLGPYPCRLARLDFVRIVSILKTNVTRLPGDFKVLEVMLSFLVLRLALILILLGLLVCLSSCLLFPFGILGYV